MQLSLRSGEKLFLNGAVIRVDRKVSIELLNDVTFLLEAHVMQPEDACTPLRQLYFTIQMMALEPQASESVRAEALQCVAAVAALDDAAGNAGALAEVARLVKSNRLFAALKVVRGLIAAGEPAAAIPVARKVAAAG